MDPGARAEQQTVHGQVLGVLGLPLPRVWVQCNLADTVWPSDVELAALEFVDCDLSGARWDDVHAPDLRIAARLRGASTVHGMSMRRAILPGLTMFAVVGRAVDLSEAVVDDASIRRSLLPRLQASLLRGENVHFCSGTHMDESDWEGAVLPGVCFSEASLIGASFRHGVFC